MPPTHGRPGLSDVGSCWRRRCGRGEGKGRRGTTGERERGQGEAPNEHGRPTVRAMHRSGKQKGGLRDGVFFWVPPCLATRRRLKSISGATRDSVALGEEALHHGGELGGVFLLRRMAGIEELEP